MFCYFIEVNAHPYCLTSQSQTLFWIGAGQAESSLTSFHNSGLLNQILNLPSFVQIFGGRK